MAEVEAAVAPGKAEGHGDCEVAGMGWEVGVGAVDSVAAPTVAEGNRDSAVTWEVEAMQEVVGLVVVTDVEDVATAEEARVESLERAVEAAGVVKDEVEKVE